jgi:hypothetical protein
MARGSELYRRDTPLIEDLPSLYDDGTQERTAR